MDERVTNQSAEWHRSILACVGALTDQSTRGWTYIARFWAQDEVPGTGMIETGVLIDLPAGLAVTRAEALIAGREAAETHDEYHGEPIIEEWAYTTDETQELIYQQASGSGPSATMNIEDGTCGECGK